MDAQIQVSALGAIVALVVANYSYFKESFSCIWNDCRCIH